jgi:hypothetical protein
MQKTLKIIESALDKIEKNRERRQALEDDKLALPEKIRALTASVAAGDAKSCNALAIAKARSEVLAQDIESLRPEFDDIVSTLNSALCEIPSKLGKAYGAEYRRVEKLCEDFVKSLLGDQYEVAEIVRTLVTKAKSVDKIDRLQRVFGGSSIGTPAPALIISKCRFALEQLQNV